ncbi:hypothetical protein Moror_15586 [Moniliophthora roreri MCA 2997]|uniref:Uncharacterized protein n=1 Tax=Moniliophthora roreri (strain MCA 2997) TaxID=1381753 RepID=V2WPC0_MONRO|nr:hypothetical protein Moror_15586 [Moniliophthora roreri MCA 2997]
MELQETYYSRLGFNGDNEFKLDSAENCIVLESNYRTMWDKYGLFCFIPTVKCTINWVVALANDNSEWERAQNKNPNEETKRPSTAYHIMLNDIRETGLEILIIDPAGFSPEGNTHILKIDGEDVPYRVQEANLQSTKTNYDAPPVKIGSTRNISPFALILNAYSKLRERDLRNPTSLNRQLKLQRTQLEELMKHIFWMPRNHPWRKRRSQPTPPSYRPSNPHDVDSRPDNSDSPGRDSYEPMDGDDNSFQSGVTERGSQHLRNKAAVQDDDSKDDDLEDDEDNTGFSDLDLFDI